MMRSAAPAQPGTLFAFERAMLVSMARKRQPIDDLIDAHIWMRRKAKKIQPLPVTGVACKAAFPLGELNVWSEIMVGALATRLDASLRSRSSRTSVYNNNGRGEAICAVPAEPIRICVKPAK